MTFKITTAEELENYTATAIEASLSTFPTADPGPREVGLHVLGSLKLMGFNILPPRNMDNICNRCRNVIEQGTVHVAFNGNQLFACEIKTGQLSPPEPPPKPTINSVIDSIKKNFSSSKED